MFKFESNNILGRSTSKHITSIRLFITKESIRTFILSKKKQEQFPFHSITVQSIKQWLVEVCERSRESFLRMVHTQQAMLILFVLSLLLKNIWGCGIAIWNDYITTTGKEKANDWNIHYENFIAELHSFYIRNENWWDKSHFNRLVEVVIEFIIQSRLSLECRVLNNLYLSHIVCKYVSKIKSGQSSVRCKAVATVAFVLKIFFLHLPVSCRLFRL